MCTCHPFIRQGYTAKANSAQPCDDQDSDDEEADDPWFEEDAEIYYDEVDQKLREHATDYMDNNGESNSAAVTYAMQNLPPINDAAFSKTKHTTRVRVFYN